jgi:hypothetical protein
MMLIIAMSNESKGKYVIARIMSMYMEKGMYDEMRHLRKGQRSKAKG